MDPNASDKDGWTPLIFAAYDHRNGAEDVVSRLLNAGAVPSLKLGDGTTVLTTPTIAALIRAAATPSVPKSPKRQRHT